MYLTLLKYPLDPFIMLGHKKFYFKVSSLDCMLYIFACKCIGII